MNFIKSLPAYLLALVYIVSGLAFAFIMLTKAPLPPMNELTTAFNTALMASGMVFVIKILEMLFAILILVPRTRTIGIFLITPITVAIFLVEALIIGMPTAGTVLIILNAIALYQRRHLIFGLVGK
jgi:hypothetical protein